MVALAGLVLAACNMVGGGRPANDPQIMAAIREYYNARALESDPPCALPQLVLFRELSVIDSFAPTRSIVVRARYNFEQRTGRAGDVVCAGQGTRTFTVSRTTTGPRVVGMSGRERPVG